MVNGGIHTIPIILFVSWLLLQVTILKFFIILHRIKAGKCQQLITLLLSGYLQLYGGLFLFQALQWESLTNTRGLVTLVPVLMDLKGNLEISRAARMGRLANTTGKLKTWHGLCKVITDNVAMSQFQVTIIAFLSVLIASIFLYNSSESLTMNWILVLYAISFTTASITCTFIGSLITFIIFLASQMGNDPDDMATSLAASFGDFITITCLIFFTEFFYIKDYSKLYSIGTIIVMFLFFGTSMYFVFSKEETRQIALNGWPPLIISMLISLITGTIFESINDRYKQITLLMPLLGGFTGNSASVIISLITTHLELIKNDKDKNIKTFLSPKDVFIEYPYNIQISRTCRSHLLHAIISCQFAYLMTVAIFHDKFLKVTGLFFTLYLLLASLLVGYLFSL